MANDLVVAGSTLARLSEAELMEVMENSVYPGAKPASIKLALAYCKGDDLDPLQKPVHIVPMKVKTKLANGEEKYVERDVIMPGINRHRVQAARSNDYAGQTEPQFGPTKKLMVMGENGLFELPNFEYPEWCAITVFRLVGGEPRPWTGKVYFLEMYATKGRDSDVPNDMWRKQAYGQLEKCAEAKALRKAFPDRAGAPTAEEMAGRVINADDTIEGTAVERPEGPREPKSKSESAKAVPVGTAPASPAAGSAAAAPRSAGSAPARSTDDLTGEKKWIETRAKQRNVDLAPLLKEAGIGSLDELTQEAFLAIRSKLLEAA